MRILSYALFVFIIFWSGFWWTTSNTIKSSINSWFKQTDQTLSRSASKVTSTGYPNRVDLNIENFSVNSKTYNFSLSSELIQLLSLVYNQKHWIGIVKTPLELHLSKSYFHIAGPPIKASFKIDNRNKPSELISEGKNLEFRDRHNNLWLLNEFLLATKKEVSDGYRTHLLLKEVSLPTKFLQQIESSDKINPTVKKISFDAIIQRTKDSSLSYQENVNINDLSAVIDWDPIAMSLKGNIQIAGQTMINGSLKIKLENWKSILLFIGNENLIERKQYRKISAALTFLASQRPPLEGTAVMIPVTFEANYIFLGPLKIGKITLN